MDKPKFSYEFIFSQKQNSNIKSQSPGYGIKFPIKNFMKFTMIDKGWIFKKTFNLMTYLYPAK